MQLSADAAAAIASPKARLLLPTRLTAILSVPPDYHADQDSLRPLYWRLLHQPVSWLLSRPRDVSDIQWREFRGALGSLAAAMAGFVALSQLVRMHVHDFAITCTNTCTPTHTKYSLMCTYTGARTPTYVHPYTRMHTHRTQARTHLCSEASAHICAYATCTDTTSSHIHSSTALAHSASKRSMLAAYASPSLETATGTLCAEHSKLVLPAR